MGKNTLDGHGLAGKREQSFTRLKSARGEAYDIRRLAALARGMALDENEAGINDGPDTEENLYVPAGYTYLGQFVDHDLTLDTTSSLDPADTRRPGKAPSNLRTPRFDLDCLYGSGPADQPYMYDSDGATLLSGGQGPGSALDTPWDLLRSRNGRAIIGDKRNDENSIVNQIQMTFLRFHNRVVQELKDKRKLAGGALFAAARDEVRWAYQRILVEDFLPRIIRSDVLAPFQAARRSRGDDAYLWYTPDKRGNLPREFVVAAYRFGHSGVRTGYRLNGQPGPNTGLALPIFIDASAGQPDDPQQSLVGFDPLPQTHVIDDWGRFFPKAAPWPGEGASSNAGPTVDFEIGGDGRVRLQFAYKFDTTLVDPLARLPPKIADNNDVPAAVRGAQQPSLALLNLLRGSSFMVRSGQEFAKDLGVTLDWRYLSVRQKAPDGQDGFVFTPISRLPGPDGQPLGPCFDEDTPLWFYILAEAQTRVVDVWVGKTARGENLSEDDLLGNPPADGVALPGTVPAGGAAAQLGPVGGRIVAEVFYGLLDADPDSVVNAATPGWQPIWGGTGPATMARLFEFTGLPIS